MASRAQTAFLHRPVHPTLVTSPVPPQVADWAHHLGTIWFDSALTSPGATSFLAIQPLFFLQGKLPVIACLDHAIRIGKKENPTGALAGFFDYEGNYCFGFYDHLFPWNPQTQNWIGPTPPRPPSNQKQIPQALSSSKIQATPYSTFRLNLAPQIARHEFLAAVRKIQAYIADGDIYQACFTYDWLGTFHGDPWQLYLSLRSLSPAPYAAFANFPNLTFLSASPELFLQFKQTQVCTRPIKGTRKRGIKSDIELQKELLASEKERAELTMITDLERNDLGRVCEFGSIHVPELFRVEHYAHVLHLVSTVCGKLRGGCSHPQALAACFPGGSITGAPKIRAMQILAELEQRPRGVYTGAIGYFGFNGNSQFNIAIRTLLLEGPIARYGTGAGIVADSIPELEWEETLAKAQAIRELSENPATPVSTAQTSPAAA